MSLVVDARKAHFHQFARGDSWSRMHVSCSCTSSYCNNSAPCRYNACLSSLHTSLAWHLLSRNHGCRRASHASTFSWVESAKFNGRDVGRFGFELPNAQKFTCKNNGCSRWKF